MKIFLRILGIAGVVAGGLVSGGVIPAAFAWIPTVIGTVAAALHPSVQATVAFGKDAK